MTLLQSLIKEINEANDSFENPELLDADALSAHAQTRILLSLESFGEILDIDFRCCEILGRESIAFPDDRSSWGSREEFERAKALCIDLGSRIYKQNPLGYGGMGLLIVLPTTVPNNTLPILHSYARANSEEPWIPLFLRPTK